MALQAEGTVQDPVSISFADIETEFGQNSKRSLGSYRISDGRIRDGGGASNFDDLPLDTGIPQSGTISLGDFYSKKLNVFVDCYSGNTEYRINARNRYNNDTNSTKVKVIGGFRNKPTSTKGTKVIIHVNKDFGSAKNDAKYVALRTGSWDDGTTLILDVGSSGAIYGAGGNGAKGRVCDGGARGGNGTSALGIEYSGATINVYSGGKIQAGYAGGGGGGGGHNNPDKGADHASSGGGGGGGAGLPAGDGGPRGDGAFGNGNHGGNGNSGSKNAGGQGGFGGSGGGADAGYGGNGGAPGQAAGDGGGGSGSVCRSGGTGAGSDGAAIRKTSGISFTINNSGTVNGATDAIGVS